VDEVLAVGDAQFQKRCVSAMQDLRSGGRTVLFVSHNMTAVENLCSRGIWIANGRLHLDGPAPEVIEAYMASFASAGSVSSDLAGVEARAGSGEIRYTRVDFLSADRQLQTVTRCGRSLVIRLYYSARVAIERPAFGLSLYTEAGLLVTQTGTWHHALDIPGIPAGNGYLELEIEALNLLPGRYSLSLRLDHWGTQQVYDALEHAVHLDVEEAPIYAGSNRVMDSRRGIVFFPQRWNLDGIGDATTVAGRCEAPTCKA
jgi:lipopolysaccharide transport system ATP-binding protein